MGMTEPGGRGRVARTDAAPGRTGCRVGGHNKREKRGDTLRGGARADTIDGKRGNDGLFGAGGNDVLVGGPGNDLLVGGAGADRLRCGPGRDTATRDILDTVAADCEVDSPARRRTADAPVPAKASCVARSAAWSPSAE